MLAIPRLKFGAIDAHWDWAHPLPKASVTPGSSRGLLKKVQALRLAPRTAFAVHGSSGHECFG